MTENDYNKLLEKFLRKEATSEETRRLTEWFCQPDTKEKLSGFYAEKWEEAAASMDAALQNSMLENIRSEMSPGRHRWSLPFGKLMKYAAAAVIPVMLGVGAYLLIANLAHDNNKEMIVSVENGQKANLQLPDGTKVWLNSGSSIRYDKSYNQHDRIIALEGEAYFEVAKDKKRPFIVKANAVSVRAVGTAFDVKAYTNDDAITTTLIEGKVNVFDKTTTSQLLPNQKITFNKSNHTFDKVQVYDAAIAGLWKNNQLAFDSETLEDIAKVLERMYNIQVVFDSEQIKQIRFSGKIKNNSLESVLQLISLTSPIHYNVKDSVVTLKQNTKKRLNYSRD
ncbi:FecR family protein [Paludibacter jiangxiensis]|uniref:Ferric-dicitrate binding protein FerR n=1 Tax=Paludibacter jiangxiensis TaxID=681398 RepID=A0A170YRM1_9BACT|nr:FecR domain-containing protein [Paludibacter jiangxiensis]GAT62008.1 ferric-dicitrate binding protein FerR [Paludibacter jiangxiensis]